MAGLFGMFKRDPRIEKYLEESEHHVDMAALRSFLRRRMEEIQRQKEEEEREQARREAERKKEEERRKQREAEEKKKSCKEESADYGHEMFSLESPEEKPGKFSYGEPMFSLHPSASFTGSFEEEYLRFQSTLDEETGPSFSAEVKRYMEEKGLKPSDVYHDAQVLKQTFSRINREPDYRPSRDTAIQICFGLHLTFEEAEQLMNRAGYHFSSSDKRDLIFQFFFQHGCFNLTEVNIALYDQKLSVLGRVY